jgi:hypothetical protein
MKRISLLLLLFSFSLSFIIEASLKEFIPKEKIIEELGKVSNSQDGNYVIPMNMKTMNSYVADIGVGTPPQIIHDVILDTGSAIFWVNSKLCTDEVCFTAD